MKKNRFSTKSKNYKNIFEVMMFFNMEIIER